MLMTSVCTPSSVRQERDEEELTLLVVDGNRQEGDEGHNCQKWKENTNEEEEFKALQPSPPVVLQVHDVNDQGPERQHPWGMNITDSLGLRTPGCNVFRFIPKLPTI